MGLMKELPTLEEIYSDGSCPSDSDSDSSPAPVLEGIANRTPALTELPSLEQITGHRGLSPSALARKQASAQNKKCADESIGSPQVATSQDLCSLSVPTSSNSPCRPQKTGTQYSRLYFMRHAKDLAGK
jgi:hypothetical protein